MTWTYDSTSIATDTAEIRLRIGDTITGDQLLTDEEIAFLLTKHPTVTMAAAHCCLAIAAKLARDVNRSAVGMSSSGSDMVRHYKEMAETLMEEANSLGELTSCGDSVSGHEDLTDDTDRVQPMFTRGQWDHNG